MKGLRIALLISGGGTTAERIIRAARSGDLSGVTPALVIASKASSPGIARAIAAGMAKEDVLVISPKDFADKMAFGEAILAACRARGVNFVGQYGWLVKTPVNVIAEYPGRIVNQHPGPLDPRGTGGDFGGVGMYGMRVHAARLAFVRATGRDLWTEATAHRVTERYDEGAVVKAKRVPILPDDTPETLRDRVLPVEYEVQIEALRDFAAGNVLEVMREEPLVRPSEEELLEECKKRAIEQYPEG